MSKNRRLENRAKNRRAQRRPNPEWKRKPKADKKAAEAAVPDFLAGAAATVAVNAVLIDATPHEKIMVSLAIPHILKLLRAGTSFTIDLGNSTVDLSQLPKLPADGAGVSRKPTPEAK